MSDAKDQGGDRRPRLRPGRPSGSTTAATRERILDVAEALFADGGYDATSIRSVASDANVAIAVVSYHVGSKAELFDAVIRRRAVIMGEMRRASLVEALASANGAPLAVERLAKAYVEPFLEFALTGDRGWRNFAVLMGRLSNSPQGTEMIRRYYDDEARAYLRELRRSLPQASADAIVIGFLGMVSLMLFVCAGTGRFEALAVKAKMDAVERPMIDHVVAFCTAGLLGLEGGRSEQQGRTAARPPSQDSGTSAVPTSDHSPG